MRIVAGNLGGRPLKSPKGHRTHPMSERARGAVFNLLGDIEGLSVLDAFAGSGALGLEALSRGAASVTALDNDKSAHSTIIHNTRQLGLSDRLKAVQTSVEAWSANNSDQQFQLVFCDPPYDRRQPKAIQKLTSHVTPGGLLVLSWPGKNTPPDLTNTEIATQKNYGDAQVVVYRKL